MNLHSFAGYYNLDAQGLKELQSFMGGGGGAGTPYQEDPFDVAVRGGDLPRIATLIRDGAPARQVKLADNPVAYGLLRAKNGSLPEGSPGEIRDAKEKILKRFQQQYEPDGALFNLFQTAYYGLCPNEAIDSLPLIEAWAAAHQGFCVLSRKRSDFQEALTHTVVVVNQMCFAATHNKAKTFTDAVGIERTVDPQHKQPWKQGAWTDLYLLGERMVKRKGRKDQPPTDCITREINAAILLGSKLPFTGMSDRKYVYVPKADGPDLYTWIYSEMKPCSLADGKGLAEQISIIHEANCVHLDIKPGNIVLSQGIWRLVDYGLFEHQQTVTVLSGTPGYFDTALRDRLGKTKQLTMAELQQGEVFSFALVLAEMFRLTRVGAGQALPDVKAVVDCPALTRAEWQKRGPTEEPEKQPLLELVESILFKPLGERPTIRDVVIALS